MNDELTRKMRYSKERVGGCEVVGVVIVFTILSLYIQSLH